MKTAHRANAIMNETALFDAFGLVGGIFHILCFLPQIYHVCRTRQKGGLDIKYFVVCLIGSICEFVYLVFNEAWASWVPMAVMVRTTLWFSFFCEMMKRHFGHCSYFSCLRRWQSRCMLIELQTCVQYKSSHNPYKTHPSLRSSNMFEIKSNVSFAVDIVGVVGGVMNTISLVPQIMHMRKTMDGRGLHKRYFLLSLLGFVFDLVYLVSQGAWAAWIPMIFTVPSVAQTHKTRY
jgi:uncharacterized protein with PQ loop repeat